MTRVLITGSFRFPDKDAAAFRVYSIAKLFGSDYEVSFAGWEKNEKENREYFYDDFFCYSTGDLEYKKSNLFVNTLRSVFRGYKTIRWLIINRKFDIIILYNPPAFFSFFLLIWNLFSHTKLILDSTEWYEPKHLSRNLLSFARFENALRMYFVYKLFQNVICISEFLEGYYSKHSIVIPPLFGNIKEVNGINQFESGIINFLYAGQMGQKDSLDQFIYLLPEISKTTNLKLKLYVLGMTFNDLRNVLSNQECFEKSKDFIVCLGRVEKRVVEEYYNKTHFVVFFREEKRYAIAGFPSKSIEAWQHGRPIITNSIGELKKYLKNNENSIVTENTEKEILKLGLQLKNIVINNNYQQMVFNSYKTFNDKFKIDVYKNKFEDFIKNLN